MVACWAARMNNIYHLIGYEGARLVFALAIGGAVLGVCLWVDANPIFSGIMAGAWGMHVWERTP